jgi:hypothetical protein
VRIRTVIEASSRKHVVLVRISGRVGGLVVIGHPVSDQDLAARQERLARRAREQGSMYHI